MSIDLWRTRPYTNPLSHIIEPMFGAFVDASKVEAVYHDGLLVLTMPKAEYAKPRQIHVEVTSAGDNQRTPESVQRDSLSC
jgi:hypothetical protein